MDATLWEIPPQRFFITSPQVHLWRARLPDDSLIKTKDLAFSNFLDEEEKARAKRFQFHRDQIQFTFCRGLLRILLGEYLQIPPQELRLGYGPQGKPHLLSKPKGKIKIQFNLSHSQGKVFFAFSPEAEVGVDLEKIKEKNQDLKLAKRYFTPEEIQWLNNKPAAEQKAALYQLWTLKEAFLKAQGLGLTVSLKSFQITCESQGSEGQNIKIKGQGENNNPWNLESFTPFQGYVASLAISQLQVNYQFFDGDQFLLNQLNPK